MCRALKPILAILFCGQVVMAQPAGTQPPAAPAAGPVAPPSETDIQVRQRATLSPGDMLNQAREYRTRMNEVASRLQSLIENARRQKDVIRLNCIMDKHAQVKGNMNIADQAIQ